MRGGGVERPLFAEQEASLEVDDKLPSEAELVLLCLDYLRDLRRSFSAQDLHDAEGIDADYLSIAIYALSRCFVTPPELTNQHHGNDHMLDRQKANMLTPGGVFPVKEPKSCKGFISVPNIHSINREILYAKNPAVLESALDTSVSDIRDEDPTSWYTYNDAHVSNGHRFYPLEGLASGPSLKGPLTLAELVMAGLVGLGARTRKIAEDEMKESPLFDQFILAVREKGFFRDVETERPRLDEAEERARLERAAQVEEERLLKVVGKFRTKLATKAQEQLLENPDEGPPLYDDPIVARVWEQHQHRRHFKVASLEQERNLQGRRAVQQQLESPGQDAASPLPAEESPTALSVVTSLTPKMAPGGGRDTATNVAQQQESSAATSPTAEVSPTASSPSPMRSTFTESLLTGGGVYPQQQYLQDTPRSTTAMSSHAIPQDNPMDIDEAERLKSVGNGHMQRREYEEAAEAYTAALLLSPNGPNAHVYYSNRAAALISRKKFQEAIADSERSVALRPDYGKAHARLGLAHFLMGNYREAVEAYTVSLKYDPDNNSTKMYLEKAAKRASREEAPQQQDGGNISGTSFSLVSELDKSGDSYSKHPQQQHSRSTRDKGDERKKIIHQKEAEKLKLVGNSQMANRDYQAALEAYSAALKLCPDGPNSHVYFSNRAAALCYLERYEEAEEDSEMSLTLAPAYGKAHARLGLSRFFMGDYAGAIDAYVAALKYDPDNSASKSYLAKAKARLSRQANEVASSKKKQQQAVNDTHEDNADESLDEIMNEAPVAMV